MGRSYQILTGALEADLLDRMREMSPTSFEGLVIDLLSKLGYGGGVPERGKAIGGPGDAGIDGVISEDALGLDRVYVSIVPKNHASRRVFEKLGYKVDDGAEARAFADEPGDVTMVIDRATFEREHASKIQQLHFTSQ